MNYLELLEESHKKTAECRDDSELEKLEFLAHDVFGFITYENEVSSLMAKKALEVCDAISRRKTFEYIADEEGHLWYLLMVNMPFFEERLSWGTSIRGAWWNLHGDAAFKVESCGLWFRGKQLLEVDFNEAQWGEFIQAMIKFSEE